MKNSNPILTLKRLKLWVTLCVAILMLTLLTLNWIAPRASAQIVANDARPMAPLSSTSIPEPPDLSLYVQNKSAAIALGKALFWDMQVGSDGVQSCASCHFHAGADNRSKNQINPGCLHCTPSPDGFSFAGPNYQSQPGDFPYHQLADPANRYSAVLRDRNEVTSSQGVFNTNFIDIILGNAKDNTQVVYDNTFQVAGKNTRRVEPRNTPTVINAVFNHRNFWDGRAHNEFNGVNPFGDSDPNAKILKNAVALYAAKIRLINSSLASQAVGPVLSDFEMSGAGRSFPKVGKKLVEMTPLAKQKIATDDSVLAAYRNASTGKGLNTTYKNMIQAAFRPELWNNTSQRVALNPNGTPAIVPTGEFTQMEYNFSLFFGLAVQLYEATLVSNQTPVDKYLAGDSNALTAQQKEGKDLFQSKCASCHDGPEFTGAAIGHVNGGRTQYMSMASGTATYDTGFYNIGVRPTHEDLAVGGKDPFGKNLSFSRSSTIGRVAVDGAFKTPGLRNVELTAPYFHNGGQLTLNQVVEFYNRGGDFHDQNIANLDPDIETLGLSAAQRDAIVSFLKGLTDERVRYHAAPFDHPELIIPNGHPGNTTYVTNDGTGQATDALITIPAIGKNGTGTKSLQTFSETRYKTVTTWGIKGYFLFLPIYGWITKQEPYQYTFTREIWTGTPPTKSFLQ